MRLEDKVIFYKTVVNIEAFNIPEIVATITVDNLMHVKLFKRNSPIPLPGSGFGMEMIASYERKV